MTIKNRIYIQAMRRFLNIDEKFRDFENHLNNFQQMQKMTLERIISLNEATRWGRDHGFSKLHSDSWENHPITTYEYIEPYIQRIKKGDYHALTYQPPLAFLLTSGTTAAPKYIPITEDSLQNQLKGDGLWNFKISHDHPESIISVMLLSGGLKQPENCNIPIKSYTQLVHERQPWYVKKRMIFPRALQHIADFDHRLLLAAQQAFLQQPTLLVSVNPLTAVRLLDLSESYHEELIRATNKERYIGTNLPLPKKFCRKELNERIKKKNPFESIKLMASWLGGTQYLFVEALRKKEFSAPIRDLGYIATEGRFSIPLEDGVPSGVINPYGVYYEFLDLNTRERVPLEDLRKNEEYNIILTAENGLYRYDISDVVRIDNFVGQAPKISFRRKDYGFSSITGEKLHENHLIEAFRSLNINPMRNAFLIPSYNPPAYHLLISPALTGKISAEFLDKALQEINPEYRAKRENERLHPITIHIFNSDAFSEIEKLIHSNSDHDRFKNKFLVPFPLAQKIQKKIQLETATA